VRVGFRQFRPSYLRYGLTATRGKLCRRPPHSHSIVSETTKLLIQLMEIFRLPPLTVRFAVKKCRLVPIDGDRWRTIPVDHIAGFTTIR
jgi:hypothetical protein